MMIEPFGDRVFVERLEDEIQKTPGGIIIPDTAKEKAQRGKVVAVGPGRVDDQGKLIAMNAKVGDIVYFGKYSGSDFKGAEGKDYLVMHESDLIGREKK